MDMYNNILDVKGLKVGQVQDEDGLTGCTVVICEEGAVCGVDVRGSAPGTRETDLLDPINMIQKVHAVVLSGGSAFGLESTCGVSQYLEERNIGFDVGVAKVPIVVGAVLFDLAAGDPKCRPDKKMGYKACEMASDTVLKQGNYGAGCGATVGKIKGPEYAMKGGIGSYSIKLDNGLVVSALIAVNAFGDVYEDGNVIAGVLDNTKTKVLNSYELMKQGVNNCLLYTSDAADDGESVDLGGRRIIKKNFFKQKTAYEIMPSLVGSEMCIRDREMTIASIRKRDGRLVPFDEKKIEAVSYTHLTLPTTERV